jgi:hypothetical protein
LVSLKMPINGRGRFAYIQCLMTVALCYNIFKYNVVDPH